MPHDLIVEGKVVNPEGIYDVQIGIDEGYITALKKQGLRGERKIETRKCLIFPGFIDIHAHLREDSSHKWDYKEDFKSGTAAALHGGITTVVDMPNTPLPGINSERIRKKKELARSKSKGLIDILFCGGVAESDMNAIAEMQKEVVAYKIYLSETTGGLYIREERLPEAINAVEATSKPVVIHCEDQRIIEKRKAELKEREEEWSRKGIHSELRPEEAELSAVKNVLASASASASGDTKINIAHVSVYETLGIIKRYKRVHCEVTPHHLFFSNNDVLAKKAFLKTNPPLRTEENRLRLLDAFKEGEIDFLVTDHAPHTKEEKARDILEAPAGVPNLDTYGNFVAWLIVRCDVHPELISRVCSYNPATFLGLNDRGSIAVGKRANLTILDFDVAKQKQVKISSERLYTKCAWSPFEGYEFPGAVRHTVFNGVVVSEHDEVVSDLFI
ncbi:Dihydroorotase [subsurface metagenome]|nr:amidohydrolase family protein [Methanosarcinales archaeon]